MKKLYLLLFLVSLGTLATGQTPLWDTLALIGTPKWNPLLDERLPRLLVLIASGSALAVAGTVMQALFQNPLASPGILGLTSGGSLFATFFFLLGFHVTFPLSIPSAAIGGSLITLLIVYFLAKTGNQATHSLVLTGIAISTLFLAIQSTLFYWYRNEWGLMQILTEWQAGSTYNRNWNHVHFQLPLTLVGLWVCHSYRQELNLLSLGDDEAKNLGVEVSKVRWRLFLSVALLSGGALASVGTIAFFGLTLPHIGRSLSGPNHETLVPFTALLGATSLPFLDLLLRLFDLYAITIGNISAILGGGFFFYLLLRTRRLHYV